MVPSRQALRPGLRLLLECPRHIPNPLSPRLPCKACALSVLVTGPQQVHGQGLRLQQAINTAHTCGIGSVCCRRNVLGASLPDGAGAARAQGLMAVEGP